MQKKCRFFSHSADEDGKERWDCRKGQIADCQLSLLQWFGRMRDGELLLFRETEAEDTVDPQVRDDARQGVDERGRGDRLAGFADADKERFGGADGLVFSGGIGLGEFLPLERQGLRLAGVEAERSLSVEVEEVVGREGLHRDGGGAPDGELSVESVDVDRLGVGIGGEGVVVVEVMIGEEACDGGFAIVEEAALDGGVSGSCRGLEQFVVIEAGFQEDAVVGGREVIILRIFDGIGERDDDMAAATVDNDRGDVEGEISEVVDGDQAVGFEEFELDEDAVVGTTMLLVGEEIAERVYDGSRGGSGGVEIGVKILDHMRMATDDGVATEAEEMACKLKLFAVVIVLLFNTPMENGDDVVGVLAASLGDVAAHESSVDKVDDVGAADGDAVGAVGVVEEGEADAVAVDDEGVVEVAFGEVAVGAEMADIQIVESGDGAFETAAALVHAMVVGGGENVETGVAGCNGESVGRREAGVAGIGRAGKGDLEVDDGDIGGLNIVLNILKAWGIVVGTVGLEGFAVERGMTHEVAGEDEAEARGRVGLGEAEGGVKKEDESEEERFSHGCGRCVSICKGTGFQGHGKIYFFIWDQRTD